MRQLLAALRFLTILPIPGRMGTAREDLTGSPVWFPVVGLVIGGIAAAAAYGLTQILPVMPAAVLVVFVLWILCGGLHLDAGVDAELAGTDVHRMDGAARHRGCRPGFSDFGRHGERRTRRG